LATYTGLVVASRAAEEDPGRLRGFRVVRAATADALAEDLAATFASAHAPGPLERCVVAVQGPGLGRWLRTDLARRLGAWGGVETPFLRSFLLDLACRGSDLRPPRGREDIDQLAFRIAAELSAVARGHGSIDPAVLTRLLRMVRGTDGSIDHPALLRVSSRLADAFDRYEVDRPELVTAWAQGRDGLSASADPRLRELEGWQRPLWRATAIHGASHAAWARLRGLAATLRQETPPTGLALPAFLSVFGVSLLSPFLVGVLQALGLHTRVTLHMLAPTHAFVAERATRRQLLWKAAETGRSEAEAAQALHMQAGHPLLDAMGRQASEAQRVLLDLEVDVDAETAATDGEPATMLARLQRDLLDDRPPSSMPPDPDPSIQVHAVATPHRAAEVAHDAVLAAMADMPGLRPERIAILTPDIAVIGNAIESVFAQRGLVALTAADARLARPSSLVVALRHAMQAVIDGMSMACAQAVLGQPGTLAALRMGPDALARWMDRLEEAGARRFLDDADRAERLGRPGTPDDRVHTLQWAVDRVVLGVAMQTDRDPLDVGEASRASLAVDADLLPSPAPGSASLEELHRVVEAIEAVADFVRQAAGERPLAAWCALLKRLAARLLPSAGHADFGDERREIDRGLERLADAATRGGFDEAVGFATARESLADAIADTREGTRFAGGGVQLARLAPMRSVPFDVLLLVGMDLGAFPRSRAPDTLDLVAIAPRPGDQLARHEDLHLFLECVHAARRRLVVVHHGIDPRAGTIRPPSPVIDQLLDACVIGSADPAGLRAAMVRTHPLRGDQPEAWLESGEAGFDPAAHACAVAAERGRRVPDERAFIDGTPVEPRVPETTHAWLKALRDPAAALLDRLGVRLPDTEALLAESGELVETGALADWQRRESCARAIFRGVAPEDWLRTMRLQGRLPHGPRGQAVARATLDELLAARAVVSRLAIAQGWLQDGDVRTRMHDHVFAVRGRAWSVQVERIDGVPVQLLWFPAGRKHHRLGLWMRHLMWSVIAPACHSVVMPLGNKTAELHLAVDPAKAVARLERLLDWATAATSAPMPTQPKVIVAWQAGKDDSDRAARIGKALQGDRWGGRGVMEDPANALVFAQQAWGAGGSVQVGGNDVSTALDEIAAELDAAMREDGWLA
jgi:exodeoxyribonuclease V gamma subunit